ncbi:DUF2155 domain-containing protein [Limibaculum sp. M0105]|uniref:DUF2155 domain-containing protein n=1 Tax=Thermohalobaculum xanthum TaxID=2753746 RepID=A0A8J7M439_9RHOB|nr:DUF2155 domain-containing protein [Thermohalobaculum xanthum]MBK0397986.1 DUF2155 domain-containing protein [Thermohalobaculum xanthum]
MRSTLFIAAILTAGLAGPAWHAAAQDQGSTIETAPLEPLRPRLPGGTIVGPETRPSLPEGVTVATPPQTAAPGVQEPGVTPGQGALGEAPSGEGAAVEVVTPGQGAATEGAGPDGAAAEAVAPSDGTAPQGAPGTVGEGGVAVGAATTIVPPESEEAPATDLFKRAPPGTGTTLGPQSPQLIDPVSRIDAPGATLRQLDKLTGEISTFDLTAGAETEVDRLRVALVECRLPSDGTTSNHIAFLRVWDTKHPDEPPVFSGWMFADSPALSAMDHPRYDVWLIHCTTVPGSASAEKP